MKKAVWMMSVALCVMILYPLNLVSAGAAESSDDAAQFVEYLLTAETAKEDCTTAKNTCPDYSGYWVASCPAGERCITFKNSCSEDLTLSYQIGQNGDGTCGSAPQCNCTAGPTVAANGGVAYWQIVDGNYTSCLPSWEPACLTAGLAVMANTGSGANCAHGTRVELTAGNLADAYGKFDSYNISTQVDDGKDWYSVPVVFKPDPNVTDPYDATKLNCRPLYCNSLYCPDAYLTPTTGGCSDGRSPQGNCAPTFGNNSGYLVEFCPSNCTASKCLSCEKNGSSTNLATGAFDGGVASSDAGCAPRNDLIGVTSGGAIYYALQAVNADWSYLPGKLAQVASADLNGNHFDEVFGLTDTGEIYYTYDFFPSWQWVPGRLNQIAACDLNGDDLADLVGIGPDGHIYYSLDKLNWSVLPGALNQLVCDDLDGDGLGEIAGVTANDEIYYTLDNENWHYLPGKLSFLAAGHINGDFKADLVGLTSAGKIFYTLDLANWSHLPGTLSQIAVGNLDSDLQGDLVGLSRTGEIYYSSDLETWNLLPGPFGSNFPPGPGLF